MPQNRAPQPIKMPDHTHKLRTVELTVASKLVKQNDDSLIFIQRGFHLCCKQSDV